MQFDGAHVLLHSFLSTDATIIKESARRGFTDGSTAVVVVVHDKQVGARLAVSGVVVCVPVNCCCCCCSSWCYHAYPVCDSSWLPTQAIVKRFCVVAQMEMAMKRYASLSMLFLSSFLPLFFAMCTFYCVRSHFLSRHLSNVHPLKPQQVVLTEKHRANDPKEKARIEKAGGAVFSGRVFGALAVSRSLGDGDFKVNL